ncbi:MAG TPA: hypothetical protein VHX43_08305 [Xanthobacteraceae bacterium]|jgi:hypothetical protein|nr:hypothetical protein [Xanthobacteraceae bacterium]
MQSESARMSSAAEAKFRIDHPNSRARAVKVIALDAASERIVKALSSSPWQRASFLTASAFSGAPQQGGRFSMGGWLNDLAGRAKNLVDEVETADLVVMVATAGENVAAAGLIGEACAAKHVMTTALIIGGATASDETLSKMLSALRPHAMMLVISSADEYISDMLSALRA